MRLRSYLERLTSSEGLMAKCLRGGGYLTAGSLADGFLRFARNLILARLLTPEAFGLMGTIIAAVAAIEAMAEIGLGQAVVQHKKGADEGFLNLVWWSASLRGLFLYLVAYLCSPFIAGFFDRPDSVTLLRVGFLVIAANGFISPRVHVLQKEMRFGPWVLLMQSPALVGMVVGVVSALLLRSVWALLFAYVTEAFLRSVLSHVVYPFKPRFSVDFAHLRDIMRFSRGMIGLPILMMVFVQTDVFVIGKVLSLEVLGMYVLARSLAEQPTTLVMKIVNPVTLPAFSLFQDNTDELRRAVLALTRVTATFGLPLLAFLVMFAGPILSVVYGPKYVSVTVPFGILCCYSFIVVCSSFIMTVLLAVGRPSMHRAASLVRTGLFLILVYPATLYFGLVGTSLAVAISMGTLLMGQLLYMRRVLRLRPATYLRSYAPGMVLSLVVLVPGCGVKFWANGWGLGAIGVGIISCLIAWTVGIISLGLLRQPRLAAWRGV